MLDLFRLEVEAQAEILNQGLLALESQPDSPQELEALMRAAHSVKGAARIVAIDGAVSLAHVMEDCFVAAQNRQVTLTADDVDQLLHGVDLLLGIGQSGGGADLDVWMTANYPDLEGTRQAIAAILDPNAAPVNSTPATASEVAAPEQPASSSQTAEKESAQAPAKEIVQAAPTQIEAAPKETAAITRDRVVRVSAENLNRIMGLAGESLVEANWLERFADSLVPLRRRQGDLSKALQGLQESLAEMSLGEEGSTYLSTSRQKVGECSQLLGDRLDELELFVRRSANLSDRLYREVIASHMRPFEDGVQGFPRMIRDLARKLDKQVRLDIIGKPTPVDRDILKKLEAPLTHILRNSVDHGIEAPAERLAAGKPEGGTVRLEASHRGGMLTITVSDDGKGIDPDQLRQKIVRKEMATEEMVAQMQIDELMEFLFLPGFSTAKQVTEISGRGVGLDIAKSMAQEVGGNVRAFSQKGKGTSFHFQLPLTLSVVRTLIAEIAGEAYAFPLARIDQIVMVPKNEVSVVENRQYFTMNGANIGLITAHQVFELDHMPLSLNVLPVIVLSDQFSQYGLIVDQFLGERDLVVRPLDPRLGKVPDINAAALREDGSLVLIVDVADLVRSMDKLLATERLEQVNRTSVGTAQLQKRILVADDSITVREMERKLLQHHGYYVEVAIDGMEAWNAVRVNQYDLVVTDIDMPRMTGFELVRSIKNHPKLHDLPVIVVSYKDREEDRVQGMEAGADYYLTKSSFHDDTLVQAVMDTIGR